jgi:hypothetical protein
MKKISMILVLLLAVCNIAQAQSLKDGDIVSIKYVGKKANPNDNKVWLSIDPGSGTVKLLPEFSQTPSLWLVKDGGGQGIFRFFNLFYGYVYGANSPELGNRSTRWLFGNPADGVVRGNENPTNPLIKWKVTEIPNTSPLQISLENLREPSSPNETIFIYPLLSGHSSTGTVSLGYSEDEGKWEVEKRVLAGAIIRNGDPGVWFLENNCRRLFPSLTVYQDWLAKGGSPALVTEERIVLESLPVCENMKVEIPPDGTYIKLDNDAGIWKMEGGKKRWIPDPCTFFSMGGYNGGSPKQVDRFYFDQIPSGPNYPALQCPVTTSSPPITGGGNTNLYSVDKTKSVWVVTVNKYSNIRVHTEPNTYGPYIDYNLNSGNNIKLAQGQWCELNYNGQWILMSDADHRTN